MEIKIDKQGNLWIKRGGEWKKQYCPSTYDQPECGDWCPLFGEPFSLDEKIAGDKNQSTLPLCQIELIGKITDERGSDA